MSGTGSAGPDPGGRTSADASPDPAAGFDPAACGVDGPLESLTFEQILSALESVTGRLAGGELGIEAAADLYEQAEDPARGGRGTLGAS